jgi:hypothetical protein
MARPKPYFKAKLLKIRNLCLAAILFSTACGGSEPTGPDIEDPGRTAVQLTVLTGGLTPFGSAAIRFPSSPGAVGTSVSGTLGSTAVQLALADSVTGMLLIPDLSPGTYELVVDFGATFQGTSNLTVGAAPVIEDPRATASVPVTALAQRVDSLVSLLSEVPPDSTAITAEQIAFLQSSSQALQAQLESATDAELRQIALWVQANPGLFDATASSAVAGPMAVTSAEVSAWVDSFMDRFTIGKIRLVATVGGCAAGMVLTGPLAAFAAVACGLSIAAQSVELGNQITHELGRIYAIPESFFVDSSGGSEAGSRSAASGAGLTSFTVEPGVPHRVDYRATFRTVTAGDRGIMGTLFQLSDELVQVVASVAGFIPGFDPPSFTPPQDARSQTLAASAGDVSANLPGCSVSASGDGATLTCSEVSANDVVVNGTFIYSNDFGSVPVTVPVTVGRTWASVGGISYNVNSTVGLTIIDGANAMACWVTMNIPVNGNTPVLFTGWNGVWSSGWTEGGSTSFTVDPKVYTGVTWLNNVRIAHTYGDSPKPASFSVDYTVTYSVPALGTGGSVSTTMVCSA